MPSIHQNCGIAVPKCNYFWQAEKQQFKWTANGAISNTNAHQVSLQQMKACLLHIPQHCYLQSLPHSLTGKTQPTHMTQLLTDQYSIMMYVTRLTKGWKDYNFYWILDLNIMYVNSRSNETLPDWIFLLQPKKLELNHATLVLITSVCVVYNNNKLIHKKFNKYERYYGPKRHPLAYLL